MRSRPPRAATWVLRHFGSGQGLDAVAGDLFEEWERGRSPTWYWRQVLVAVVVGFTAEIWRHKLIAIRAVCTGWAVTMTLGFIWGQSLAEPYWDLFRPVLGWRWGLTVILALPILVPIYVSAGWAVARFHRSNGASMVLLYAFTWWLWNLPWLCQQIENALAHPRYLLALRLNLANLLVTTLSILIGGLWTHGKRTNHPTDLA